MLTRVAIATAAVLLGCGSAYAQAPLNVSPLPPLGITSPFGIPNAPVGHTGIPIGATELATPGVSPTTFGASPLIGATCAGASPAPASAFTSSPMTGASALEPDAAHEREAARAIAGERSIGVCGEQAGQHDLTVGRDEPRNRCRKTFERRQQDVG